MVQRIGDRLFDPSSKQEAIAELVNEIRNLNCNYIFKIQTVGAVPAIRVDAVDGRRVEIGFDEDGRNISEEHTYIEPPGGNPVIHAGTVMIEPLEDAIDPSEERRYRFRDRAVPFDEGRGASSLDGSLDSDGRRTGRGF